ncbi:hypothetical protein BAE44_0024286 [Dichanthelium oligosanthes]|uniref:FBD domain-containing protein n=1 Tax=Dichanthelium oligosanthes TaxID=888268 RepID=A0A1E5UPB2_9POAL|nr:hypothetical protein BAE44_0024286 [Dichanthelium oligosanthes]
MRVLKINFCFSDPLSFDFDDDDDDQAIRFVRIMAPRLEEIALHNYTNRRRPDLDIHDMGSVRRLTDLHLDMHGPYCYDKESCFWLLENCPGVQHIDVWLNHYGGCAATDRDLVDLTSEGAAPFASVRSMVIRTRSWRCFCNEVDTWKFHRKLYLGSLEEDMDLLTRLFESSNSIRSVALHAIPLFSGYVSLKRMMSEEDEKDMESIAQKLQKIPYTHRGYRHFGKDATWTSYAIEKAIPW